MKFIAEVTDNINVIKEEVDENGKQNYFIEGIFLECDIKNRNGRIYPLDTVIKEVNRYDSQFIQTKRALGELGHPDSGQINLDRVSHLITGLRPEGKVFIGKAKLLDTLMGKIAQNFVEEGVRLGVSSRGFGTMKEKNGVKYVGEDFYLSTVDIVADPSAPHAFVEGIMESKEFYFENGILKEMDYETIQKRVKSMSKTEITEGALMKMFEDFMKKL